MGAADRKRSEPGGGLKGEQKRSFKKEVNRKDGDSHGGDTGEPTGNTNRH